ncbi:MAG: ATP-binding cassette domain-containing protein [Actinomycetaceae bacterium]|nr:ATP-binding cassette domain-containing protein [Actinomycetaceae bacterium]
MISLSDIRKEFRESGGQVRVIFDGMDFSVGDGAASVAVLGRSGSGKTTLLRMLAGLDIDYSGSYEHDGEALRKTDAAMAAFRRETIGYISQHYDLLADRNVAANVALALGSGGRRGGRAEKVTRALRAEKIARALEMVGLGGFEKKRVRQLSGGEAQRVAIARALAKDASIILADEPTGALDEATEDDILALFDDLQERDVTFVIATHSPKVAARCARRLEIRQQRLVEQ